MREIGRFLDDIRWVYLVQFPMYSAGFLELSLFRQPRMLLTHISKAFGF